MQSFAFVAIGGVIVGALVAAGWVFLARRLQDRMLVMLITILLCWAAYLAGEAVHVSGVIATVTAGLAMGWYQHEILSADVRLRANSAWFIMVFVLEALVFILIGFSLRGALERIGGIEAMPLSWVIVIAAVVITLTVARFVWIFGSEAVLGIARKLGLERARPLGWRQATVLSWTGMRGVVTLAVPLTLPVDMPGRDLMLICAFAVIFVTVVAQGSSLGMLIRAVKPVDTDPPAKMAMPAAEAAMARARFAVIERLAYDENGTLIHPLMLEEHRKRMNFMERYEADASTTMDGLRSHFDVLLQAIAGARAELIRIHRAGLIEDEVLHELERDLDVEELAMTLQRGE